MQSPQTIYSSLHEKHGECKIKCNHCSKAYRSIPPNATLLFIVFGINTQIHGFSHVYLTSMT